MSSNVDQIKSRISIADLVGSYLKLYKAGANFKAVCPFHNEKTPSFFISPARESWHCFGCNRGGDIFSFVMEIEGIDFLEALKMLALRAGVELKRENPTERNEKEILTKITEASVSFYQGELNNGSEAYLYLKARGLNDDTIKNFHIGFAKAGWRNLYDFLKSKKFSDSDIEKAGMVIKSPKGLYDRFRSRIMFPIFNSLGQPVGFSGRIFGEESQGAVSAKYINSPQTPLFDKSKVLYGFDKARNSIRQENTCILVEGQMDLLMSQQTSTLNTVATSGTALTEEHLKIIRRLADNLVLSFDTDEAGLAASERAVGMALSRGFDVKIAEISEKDPADLIKKNQEEWEEAISKAQPFITFYLNTLILKFKDIKDARKEVEKKIVPLLAKIQSEIERSHYVKETAKAIRLQEEPVMEELNKFIKNNKKKVFTNNSQNLVKETSRSDPKNRRQSIEDRLLGLILWQKKKEKSDFKPVLDAVAVKCFDLFSDEGKNLLKKENSEFDEKEKKSYNKLTFEAELSYGDSETLDKEAEILLAGIEKEDLKEKLEDLSDKIRQFEIAGDQENLSLSLKKFQELIKLL